MKKITQGKIQPGEEVFHQGDKRDYAYLLADGEIEILHHINGEEIVKDVLGPGELFGEMALMEDGPRTATARAKTKATLFVIPKGIIHDRLELLDPVVGSLFALLIDRYRHARLWEKPRLQRVIGDRHEMDVDSKLIAQLKLFQERAIDELNTEDRISQAITNQEFLAHLQPIVSLHDQSITGFETLIRWNDPTKGLVSPDQFIPVAERTNLVQHLDRMMLNNASDLLPALSELIGEKIFISVNFSGASFIDEDVVANVREALDTHNIDAENIKLEITESALIDDPDNARKTLSKLKDLGVTIALDDFGTGYSSLSYLHRFPIDSIKIDKSFIQDMHNDAKSKEVVQAIVNMAEIFDLDVIAEGIEDVSDIPVLIHMGCEMGQGYAFGKPLDPAEIRTDLAVKKTQKMKSLASQ